MAKSDFLEDFEQETIKKIQLDEAHQNFDNSTIIQSLKLLSRNGVDLAEKILEDRVRFPVVDAAIKKSEEQLQSITYNSNKMCWNRFFVDIPYDALSPEACKLFMIACNLINPSGIFEASTSDIQNILSVKRQTAIKAVKELIKCGFIVKAEDSKSGRGGHPTRFMINPRVCYAGKSNSTLAQQFSNLKPEALPKSQVKYSKIQEENIKYIKFKKEEPSSTQEKTAPKTTTTDNIIKKDLFPATGVKDYE